MKDKHVSQKLFKTALLGTICVAPFIAGTAANADRPNHNRSDRSFNPSQKKDGHRDSRKSHDENRGRGNHTEISRQDHVTSQSQSHTYTQSHHSDQSRHNTYPSHTTDRSHRTNQPHTTYQSHVRPTEHHDVRRTNSREVVIFRGNRDRDDNWHHSHGYTRRGSNWYWRDHDDAWWHNNGYYWSGNAWLRPNNSHHNYVAPYSGYSAYRNFTGVVTRVYYGEDKIDVRIDGRIFNVYLSSRLPYRLNRGDVVRVYGRRYGNNDIRNSSVRVLRNR
jgi:hypothetical protein